MVHLSEEALLHREHTSDSQVALLMFGFSPDRLLQVVGVPVEHAFEHAVVE